jgi:hypothetical protein
MGAAQDTFLAEFQQAFRTKTGLATLWTGGQVLANIGGIPVDRSLESWSST